MDALAADLAQWRRHTAGLSKHALAAVDNGRGGSTELVAAVEQMRDAFAAAVRQAQQVERLAAQAQQARVHAAAQAARKRAGRPAASAAPSPEQARWMAELTPEQTKGARRAAAAAAPKGALSESDRQAMWELFQDMDDDASGALEVEEFAQLAESLGRKLSERECRDAMAEMDADGSGAIDFEEFANWWAKNKNSKGRWVGMVKDRAREKAWAAETKRRIAESEAQPAEVVVPVLAVEAFGVILRHLQDRKLMMADLFAMMDRDGGGEIDIAEMGATLQWLGLSLSAEALASVIEVLDVDGGGTVDREEFFSRVREISRQRRKAFSGDRAFTAPPPSGGRRGRPGSAAGVFRFRSMITDPRSTLSLQDLGKLPTTQFDVVGSLPPFRRRAAVG